MNSDFLKGLHLQEGHQRECKLAAHGLPESIWETYSSFANTEGGTILLGVREKDGCFTVQGLTDQQIVNYQKDFWNTLNNRQKVSRNVLLNHHVSIVEIDKKRILRIDVPPADRREKPIYIGLNPMKGTYRRDYEGDYLCSEEEVRGMFADQEERPVDARILDEMGLDVLNADSVKGYRILFQQLHINHPWNLLMDDEFLLRLHAAAKNNAGSVSPTVAGLLMFGEAYQITEVFPDYFLDYREETDEEDVRWLFRVTSDDGDWSGNLFDFYYKVVNRLDDDIAVPFAHRRNGVRVDHTNVHEALGEAVANALVHANYYGRRGIVIIKNRKKISISNPGTLRVTKEEFFAGGTSDPRNPNILKMFGFINIGERAGSGIEKILSAWKEQNWPRPEFEMTYKPERVTIRLKVGQIVYIPGALNLREEGVTYRRRTKENFVSSTDEIEAKENFENTIDSAMTGRDFESIEDQGTSLTLKEERILDYVKQQGSIRTGIAAQICDYRSRSSARNLLERMTDKKLLKKVGKGASTSYILFDDASV